MPGTAIRVPANVYPVFPNGQRVITRPTHFTMQPNGVHINGAYMPGIPFGNNPINVIRRIPNQPNLLKIPREACFMRLLSFAEHLGDNIIHWKEVHWRELTNRFFADDTSMKYTLWAPHTQKKFGNPRLAQYNQVLCPSASIVYHYSNGIQVVAPGQLTVIFNASLKMMDFDFVTTRYTEYLPKQRIHEFIQIPSPLNEYGIPHKTMRCLEVGEGVDYMHEVMMHTINNPTIGPI
ncbi:29547_t:CDS:2, partial [Racocetra persica]